MYKNEGWGPWTAAKQLGIVSGPPKQQDNQPKPIVASASFGPSFRGGEDVFTEEQAKNITGHSLEEHSAALEKAKMAGDTQAVKAITDDYNREMEYQTKIGTFDKKEETALDKKNKQSYLAIENFINNLENHFYDGGGGTSGKGVLKRISGIKKDIEATAGYNEEANIYNRQKKGFAATLKTLTGDMGTLTEEDYKRLAGILPDFGSTQDEAKTLFKDLRSQLASKFKIDEDKKTTENLMQKTGSTEEISQPQFRGGQEAFMSAPEKVEKKEITPENMSGDKFTQSIELAKQAVKETDSAKKQLLLQQSRDAAAEGRGVVSQIDDPDVLTKMLADVQKKLGSSEILPALYATIGGVLGGPVGAGIGGASGEYLKTALNREDEGDITLKEAGGVLLKGAEYYILDRILLAGGKFIKNAWEAKTLNPSKINVFLREKAADLTPKINTKEIISAGDKWAKLDPQSLDTWNDLKSGLSPNMDTKDLLDLLTAWGKRTWTLSGAQRDKAGAELMKHIYTAGRETIFDQAPEIAKYTANLKSLKDLPEMGKAAQKASWLILKLLGIGKLL